jgi:hypothetical protein
MPPNMTDPAMQMPFPKGKIVLEPKGEAIPGKKLTVKGRTDALKDGKAIVTFEIERKQIRGDVAAVEMDKPGADKRIVKNYETANNKVVARAEVKVEGGAFEASLSLPDDLMFTKHFLKAYAWSASGDAAGSLGFDDRGRDEESDAEGSLEADEGSDAADRRGGIVEVDLAPGDRHRAREAVEDGDDAEMQAAVIGGPAHAVVVREPRGAEGEAVGIAAEGGIGDGLLGVRGGEAGPAGEEIQDGDDEREGDERDEHGACAGCEADRRGDLGGNDGADDDGIGEEEDDEDAGE